jgi:hypothetical protein
VDRTVCGDVLLQPACDADVKIAMAWPSFGQA